MIKKIIILLILLIAYYQLDYKRYFIYNNDKTKVFTVWKRLGWHFYIVPGKYYSPFAPNTNYIYASNQGISVLFDTRDSHDYKLEVYYKEISQDFNSKIKVYRNRDSLYLEYGILKEINSKLGRIYHENRDSMMRALDYKYISMELPPGIDIFDFKEE